MPNVSSQPLLKSPYRLDKASSNQVEQSIEISEAASIKAIKLLRCHSYMKTGRRKLEQFLMLVYKAKNRK